MPAECIGTWLLRTLLESVGSVILIYISLMVICSNIVTAVFQVSILM